MIKLQDILLEVDQETVYPFKKYDVGFDEEDDSLLTVDYLFTTPQNNYKVSLYSGEYYPEDKTFDLSFGIDTGSTHKLDTFQTTGEGNIRIILKTIASIIEEFFSEYSEEAQLVVVDGTSEKRRRVYKALLPKYLSPNTLSKVDIK
tara:strand:- start:473 stop:910 length:438 start_codon:yes stop_codon:yes gene_type:complete